MSGSVYLSEDLKAGTEYQLNMKTSFRVNGDLINYKTQSFTVRPEDIGSDRRVGFSNTASITVNGTAVSSIGTTSSISGYCIDVDVTYIYQGSTKRVPVSSGNGRLLLYADCNIPMKSGTFIGSDGLISKKGTKEFKLDNSGQDQRIYIKGLTTTKPTTSGELYISDQSGSGGLIDGLIQSFTDLKSVLGNIDFRNSQAKWEEYRDICFDGGTTTSWENNRTCVGIIPSLQKMKIIGIS